MLLTWVSGITDDPGVVPFLHLVAKAQLPFSIVETLQPYRFPSGSPRAGWLIYFMENPILQWMILGYPHFRKPQSSELSGNSPIHAEQTCLFDSVWTWIDNVFFFFIFKCMWITKSPQAWICKMSAVQLNGSNGLWCVFALRSILCSSR